MIYAKKKLNRLYRLLKYTDNMLIHSHMRSLICVDYSFIDCLHKYLFFRINPPNIILLIILTGNSPIVEFESVTNFVLLVLSVVLL